MDDLLAHLRGADFLVGEPVASGGGHLLVEWVVGFGGWFWVVGRVLGSLAWVVGLGWLVGC